MLEDNWTGLYRKGWGSRLRPASYAHPAKNSYGLSVRIYEHALAEGWVRAGDKVVDCFAGVGGFALEAMRHGLHFRGVELEMRFVDMGQGCDCTGISKEDWARYQGRWDRMRYAGDRHWCPECLMKAGMIAGEQRVFVRKFKHPFSPLPLPGTKRGTVAKTHQATIFDAASTASYVRSSGKVPCTGAHHYCGNIETWERQGMAGSAVIVQGDSRRLGEVLARASLCLSSPPYAGSIHEGGHGIDAAKLTGNKAGLNSQALIMDGYGRELGQLAALPESDHAEACERPVCCVSSPPWEASLTSKDEDFLNRKFPSGNQALDAAAGYGSSAGQLGQMPTGSHAEALEAGAVTERPQACISSPPWEKSLDNILSRSTDGKDGGAVATFNRTGKWPERRPAGLDYGKTEGQLGQETGSTFWAASRTILEQVYQVLAPGGHAIWVVKMFVRNKQLVDFPGQWEALCQSVGFRTVCKHRAWLNKNAGVVQVAFDGEEVSMEKWFKSFFRRLAESKGSPRIDWELVLCMVKE